MIGFSLFLILRTVRSACPPLPSRRACFGPAVPPFSDCQPFSLSPPFERFLRDRGPSPNLDSPYTFRLRQPMWNSEKLLFRHSGLMQNLGQFKICLVSVKRCKLPRSVRLPSTSDFPFRICRPSQCSLSFGIQVFLLTLLKTSVPEQLL